MRKLTAAAVVVAAMVFASSALAATAAPTVAVTAPTAIGDTAATLHGTVNPHGLATTYQFQYGTTTALGKLSPATAASAGAGTAAVAKSVKLSGLSPDTTYYYELVATNSDGPANTTVASFKTTGNPAPGVTTEPASGVGRYAGNLVGTIAPNNGITYYYFQYGLTTSYGFQTGLKSIAAGSTPITVADPLPGLQPGTVFHYRLIAYHGSTSTSYGADVAFQTVPWPRPHSGLSLSVSPRSATKAPSRVTASGKLSLAYTTPPAAGCHGSVMVRIYRGSTQVGSVSALVHANCTYHTSTRISGVGKGRSTLTVKAHYRGDTWQAPADAKSASLRIG